jgi:hypothetical protein
MKGYQLIAILAIVVCAAAVGGCSSKEKSEAGAGLAYQWGPKHVCLPCHEQRAPIARNHNYYCTACHGGVAYATDKEVGHRNLFAKPQLPGQIEHTCHQCHMKSVGKEIPYDAEFVRDVLISHGDYARNTNIPETYQQQKFKSIDEKFKPAGAPTTETGGAKEAAPAAQAPKAGTAPATKPSGGEDEFFDDMGGSSNGAGGAEKGVKGKGEEGGGFDEDFFLEEE